MATAPGVSGSPTLLRRCCPPAPCSPTLLRRCCPPAPWCRYTAGAPCFSRSRCLSCRVGACSPAASTNAGANCATSRLQVSHTERRADGKRFVLQVSHTERRADGKRCVLQVSHTERRADGKRFVLQVSHAERRADGKRFVLRVLAGTGGATRHIVGGISAI
jgi:hypothetical protein